MHRTQMDYLHMRDYQAQDYDQIMDLWMATGLGGRNRGDDRQIIQHSLDLGGRLIVVEDTHEQMIVGSSWMTFDGRRIHLHHIGVLPKYRNLGLAKWLTRESLKFAQTKGYQIKLEVREDNTHAIELYKKMGFNRLGDYDIYIVRDVGSLKF